MARWGVVLIILAVLAAFLARTAWAVESVAELNKQALTKVDQGDYSGAVASLVAARAADPGNATLKKNHAYSLNAWGVALGQKGEYEQGLARLAQAQALEPQNTTIRQNLAIMRANWAQVLMGQDRLDEASRQLDQAEATADDNARREITRRRANLLLLQARAERARRQDDNARRNLNQAYRLDPQNAAVLIELGELNYAAGDNLGALEVWLKAETLRPDAPGLSDLIDKVSRETLTEESFKQRESGDFRIAYEGKVSEAAARETINILNDARREVGQRLGLVPIGKIQVVLYSRDQYTSATTAPHWTGGLYDGKIRVPLGSAEDDPADRNDPAHEMLRQTLYHEYTHALIADRVGRDVPSWLNEGLAMYNEVEAKDREIRDERDRRHVAEWARAAMLPSVADLPALFSSYKNPLEADRAYTIARTFTVWLAERYRPSSFKTLLQAMAEDNSLDQAIERTYGKPLSRLNAAWRQDLAAY